MKPNSAYFYWAWLAIFATVLGCASQKLADEPKDGLAHYQQMANQIDVPADPGPTDTSLANLPAPSDLKTSVPTQYWDMSLQETMKYAMAHARILQDLGGTVLRAPETVATSYLVALQETDPQSGPEAALSLFDAQLTTSLFAQDNKQQFNNRLIGNNGYLAESNDNFETQISKRAATGDLFTIRHSVDYTTDNNLDNQFAGAWDSTLEAEIRHPFLQGAGVDFNRIAGPGAHPGTYNGVVVARLKSDVTVAEFRIGLRDYVSNLENAYWDLYFAYHDLDTKILARDEALETWRNINARHQSGQRGGEADKEAQAREQYFQFQEDVQNALVGRELEGTRTNNGSTPGTFRGQPGVRVAERKLRLLMGLPPTDGRVIRPCDEPPVCAIQFDWSQLAIAALHQREELRRQRFIVKAREMELNASANFSQPNLDFVGRYGVQGYGKNLIDTDRHPGQPFDSAYRTMVNGDFPEWQVGLEFSMPIGFRQAHAGVRNAELQLTQARAILCEQEKQVMSSLTGAVDQVSRRYLVLQTSINRAIAARDQLKALRAAYENDKVELFIVLDAHRRYTEALSNYYQTRVEYALAVRNVHFEQGTLLEYCDIALAEGSNKAALDAARRDRLRGQPRRIDFRLRNVPVASQFPSTAKDPSGLQQPRSTLTAREPDNRNQNVDLPLSADETTPAKPASKDNNNVPSNTAPNILILPDQPARLKLPESENGLAGQNRLENRENQQQRESVVQCDWQSAVPTPAPAASLQAIPKTTLPDLQNARILEPFDPFDESQNHKLEFNDANWFHYPFER